MTKKPFKKYKYEFFEFHGGMSLDSAETIQALNKLGTQGWLLIHGPHESSRFDGTGKWWDGLFVKER
jgi:hypothetical protein